MFFQDRWSSAESGSLSIGPSGLDLEGNKVTEPMAEEEIAKVIEAFADAAANAKRLGFDGVEIQGAHGYLVDQFFWEKTNQRTDRYGGNIIKRAQFAVELVEAIRAAVGPDYPINELLERLNNNEFDLVAVGRALLSDPAWATKIREGRIHDLQTFTPEALKTLF